MVNSHSDTSPYDPSTWLTCELRQLQYLLANLKGIYLSHTVYYFTVSRRYILYRRTAEQTETTRGERNCTTFETAAT